MATIAQAVISREAGAPTRVEEMVVEDPGPGEVLVRIQASGVCHTDLHYKLGRLTTSFPSCSGTRLRVSWSRWGRGWSRRV